MKNRQAQSPRRRKSLRGYHCFIVILPFATFLTWLFFNGSLENSNGHTAAEGALFQQVNNAYSSSELRWLMSSWPGTLFLIDPEVLDCIARTDSTYGTDFCSGILFQKDMISLGSTYKVTKDEIANFSGDAGESVCLVQEMRSCYPEGKISPQMNGISCTKEFVSHIFIQRKKERYQTQMFHIIMVNEDRNKAYHLFRVRPWTLKNMRKCRFLLGLVQDVNGAEPSHTSVIYGNNDFTINRIVLRKIQLLQFPFPLLILKNSREFVSRPRYIPCKKLPFAASYQISTPSVALLTEHRNFRHVAKKILRRTKAILEKLNVAWWISSGTLLGWFRQCDVIPYSNDIDIGIWIRDYTVDIQKAFEEHQFEAAYRLGTVNDSLQLSFATMETKLDIYFYYEESDHVWNGATAYRAGQKFKYVFPKFELCWTTFLEVELQVPCNPLTYIEANYGKNWTVPISDWDWRISPPNSRLNGFWSEAQRLDAIYLNPKLYYNESDMDS